MFLPFYTLLFLIWFVVRLSAAASLLISGFFVFVLFLFSHVGAYSFDLLRVCFLHLLIWCVLLSACPMFLPFLLLIHGILAVSLSHSHLPFLHEFIL